MEYALERALVVDASFTSRRKLVSDLRNYNLANDVLEARSVPNGLDALRNQQMSACVMGPTLSEQVAVEFVTEGLAITRETGCAFISVVSPQNDYSEAVLAAGADGVITIPYERKSFTDIVRTAIVRSRDNKQITVEKTLSLQNELRTSARSLRKLAEGVLKGNFSIADNGAPSLATRDAIRLAVQRAISAGELNQELAGFDRLFVSAVVDWFAERPNKSHAEATEGLRKKLLSFHAS